MAEKELIFDIVVETNKAVADIKGMLAKTEAEAKKSGSKAGNEFVKGIKGEIANLKIDILQGVKIDKGRIDSLRNQINQGLLEAKITPTQAYSMLSQLESASKKVGGEMKNNLKSKGGEAGNEFGNNFKTAITTILGAISFDFLKTQINNSIAQYDKLTKSNVALEGATKVANEQLAKTGSSLQLTDVNKKVDELFKKFKGAVSKKTLGTGFADFFRSGITDIDEVSKALEGYVDIAVTGKSEFVSLDDAVSQLTEQFRSERAALGETAGLTDEYISQILPRGLEMLQAEGKFKDKKVDDLTKEERAMAKLKGLTENFNLVKGNFNEQEKQGLIEQEKFASQLTILQQEFGKIFKPLQILVFKALTPFVKTLAEFVEKNPEIALAITGLVVGFIGLVTVFTGLSFLLPVLTTGFTLFSGAVGLSLLPILGITLAIGAVIAIGFLLWKNWDFIMEKAKELGDFIGKKFTEIKDKTIENFTKMKDNTVKKFTEIKDSVVEFLTKMKDDSVKKITEMKDLIVSVWTEFVDFITDPNKIIYAIGYLVGFIVKQWVDTFIFVKDTAIFAFNSIIGFIMGIPAVLGAFFEFIKQQGFSAWEFMKTTAINSFNAFIGFILSLPSIISTTFENIKNGAIQKFEELKNGAIQVLENLKNGFVQKFEDIKKWGSDKINEMKDNIVNTFNSLKDIDLYEIGKRAIQSLINGIGSKINDLKNTLSGLGDSFKAGFGAGFSGQAFADGGLVKGKNVLALLNDGNGQEFVMNADATRQFLPLLKAMNNGGGVSNIRNDNQNINSNNNINYNNYGNKDSGSTLPFMLNYV